MRKITVEMIDLKIKELDEAIAKGLEKEEEERINGFTAVANIIRYQVAVKQNKRCELYEMKEGIEKYGEEHYVS